jgi:hypothetical protein
VGGKGEVYVVVEDERAEEGEGEEIWKGVVEREVKEKGEEARGGGGDRTSPIPFSAGQTWTLADRAQDVVPDQPFIQGLRGILGQYHQPAGGSYVNPTDLCPSIAHSRRQ